LGKPTKNVGMGIQNKEEVPQQWKESIIVLIYKKGDKPDCNNYQRISLLSTAYKIYLTFSG
jgi:hypothetical protein